MTATTPARVLFYRSFSASENDMRHIGALAAAAGVVFEELPGSDGTPDVPGTDIEVAVHASQPFDLDPFGSFGRVPDTEEARNRGFMDVLGAVEALLLGLRGRRYQQRNYRRHYDWGAAHENRVKRVRIVTGGDPDHLPAAEIQAILEKHRGTTVEVLRPVWLPAYLEHLSGSPSTNTNGDRSFLWMSLNHALYRRDIQRSRSIACQMIRAYANDNPTVARDLGTALDAKDPLSALAAVRAPAIDRSTGIDEPLPTRADVSIHILSRRGIPQEHLSMLTTMSCTVLTDSDPVAALETVHADPLRVLIVDHHDSHVPDEAVHPLVALAKSKGMLVVSWSEVATAPIAAAIEAHGAEWTQAAGFRRLVTSILARLDERRPECQ